MTVFAETDKMIAKDKEDEAMAHSEAFYKKPDECHYSFFQHKECEFFPCHPTDHPEDFNCLFCYCPLYALGTNARGISCTRRTA